MSTVSPQGAGAGRPDIIRRHQRILVVLLAAAALLLVAGSLVGRERKSESRVALEGEQADVGHNMSDTFRGWWHKIQGVEKDIIRLKDASSKKADEEVRTLSHVKQLINHLQSKWPLPSDSEGAGEASKPVQSLGDAALPPAPEAVVVISKDGSWTYGEGIYGPEYWGDIHARYELCSKGKSQSPVEIDVNEAKEDEDLVSVSWQVEGPGPKVADATSYLMTTEDIHKKRGLIVELSDGPVMVVGGIKYRLQHMVFHTPAEHVVNGKRAPAEIQFVHQATDGSDKKLGVALFLEQGASQAGFVSELLSDLSLGRTQHTLNLGALSSQVLVGEMPDDATSLAAFHPNFRSYYQYQGSITTPPCTEDVTWLVLKNHVAVGTEKIKALQGLQGFNSRPTQPLNGRVVLEVGNDSELRNFEPMGPVEPDHDPNL